MVGYYPNQEGQNIQTQTEARVADTRSGLGGGTGPIKGGTVRTFQIAGNGGVPLGVKSVALNLTAINPSGGGHLRVYPHGTGLPNASVINYIPGVTKAAFVVVEQNLTFLTSIADHFLGLDHGEVVLSGDSIDMSRDRLEAVLAV